MPLYDGARCDLCSQDKKEANGWFTGRVEASSLVIRPLDIVQAKDWVKSEVKFYILCGPNCATTWVNQEIQKLGGGETLLGETI
jgi:hypothetical protein